ncbi:MAG: acetate--CoA ligase family protein [Candidatus Hermodarchaeia archaeon]
MGSTSLDSLFRPKSIAVIGASDKPDRIGYQVMRSLQLGKFPGTIYPINPRLKTVLGLSAYPSIEIVPENIDLAIVVLRKERVLDAIDASGRKGVKSVIVMSSGFSELGDDTAEGELIKLVQKHGMRMLGPNCAGYVSTWENIYASFENRLQQGHLAFLTQSGAMSAVVLALARAVGLGLSIFVSYGNAADVGPEELLQYLQSHKPTQIIGGYLEGITNARQFLSVAQKITPHKPLVVLKPGDTIEASRAIRTHTGAMAGDQAIYMGAFRQAGILQASSLDEFIDACQVLVTQPLPTGKRIGIITNAGGPGVLAVDACAQVGLDVSPFPANLVNTFKAFLPPFCPMGNPVDVGPEGTPEVFQRVTEILLRYSDIDMVLVLNVPTAFSSITSISKAIGEAKKANPQKPLITCWLAGDIVEEGLPILAQSEIPNFGSPKRAAKALHFLSQRAEWLSSH